MPAEPDPSSPDSGASLVAPPMPVDATVRSRQGECGVWSAWSDPQTAKAVVSAPAAPKIVGTLRHSQNAIIVTDIFYAAGTIRVVSKRFGVLAQSPVLGGEMTLAVAPSLHHPDEVTVTYAICDHKAHAKKPVEPLSEFSSQPSETPPFPREDWFEPFERVKIKQFEHLHVGDH